MKLQLMPAAHELISNMRNFFQPNNTTHSYRDEEPIRAQLLSAGQMEDFGKFLAGKHKLSTKPAEEIGRAHV